MNRQHRSWRNTAERIKREAAARDLPCGICGRPIDYTASGRSPLGPQVDHLTPLAQGGDLLPGTEGLRVTHASCNARRGDGRRFISPWGW